MLRKDCSTELYPIFETFLHLSLALSYRPLSFPHAWVTGESSASYWDQTSGVLHPLGAAPHTIVLMLEAAMASLHYSDKLTSVTPGGCHKFEVMEAW